MNKETTHELDIIAHCRAKEVFEWAQTQKWFDDSFIYKMTLMKGYSDGQRQAINKLWEKFCKEN